MKQLGRDREASRGEFIGHHHQVGLKERAEPCRGVEVSIGYESSKEEEVRVIE